jgi:hypothetical protein
LIWLLEFAILFALWRSDGRLRWYFLSQATATPILSVTARLYSDTSTTYLWAYTILTGLILACVVALAWEFRYWRGMAIAGVLALAVGHFAELGLVWPIKHYEAVGLAEGAILFWAALVLGGTAPYRARPAISFTLALLWFAQALFRWGFILNLPSEEWLAANWFVPPVLCIVAFVIVGVLRDGVQPVPQRHA